MANTVPIPFSLLLLLAITSAMAEEVSDRCAVVGGRKMGALDLATGQWIWKRNGWGTAWAGAGGMAYLAPDQGGLECVAIETGESRWRLAGSPRGFAAGPTIWIAHTEDTVSAVSLQTGQTIWKVELGQAIDDIRPPAIVADDDAVFVHVRDGLVALSTADGSLRWKRGGEGFERLQIVHGRLYACAKYGGTPAYVRCFDRSTGKEFWRCEIPTDLEPEPVFPESPWSQIIVTSADSVGAGWTHALFHESGKVKWSFPRATAALWTDDVGGRTWIAMPPELRLVDSATGEGRAIDAFERDGAAFLRDGERMLVADFDKGSCGVGLRAYHLKTGDRLWTATVHGIDVPHSEYTHRVRLERIGRRVVLIGESSGGTYVNVVDPETGTVTLSSALR